MTRARMNVLRRTVLIGIPTSLAFTVVLDAIADQRVTPSGGAEASADYCGLYRFADDHHVGIERFVTDNGESVLLFADYKTSAVRRLFAVSDAEFVYGPNMGTRDPVEATVTFNKNADGSIGSISIRRANAADAVATKLATTDQEVVFQQRDARIAGRLTLPPGAGPHPAIVLLHGSGPLTRHSFGPYVRFFNSLGLAVLVYDKRGTGASTGIRVDAGSSASKILYNRHYPDDLVRDALAAHDYLQQRPEIDERRIGFWGSSEGGMLSIQAAARNRDVAFAINSSGFVGPLWETLRWQPGAIMRSNNAAPTDIAEADAFAQLWMDVARTGRGYDEFERQRDALIARRVQWPTYTALQFNSLEQMRWAWRRILSFDSLPALRRVRCPILGVFGEKDVLTDGPRASASMLQVLAESGNRDFDVHVFANASHSLMDATTRAEMAPGVFSTLGEWLRTRAELASN